MFFSDRAESRSRLLGLVVLLLLLGQTVSPTARADGGASVTRAIRISGGGGGGHGTPPDGRETHSLPPGP